MLKEFTEINGRERRLIQTIVSKYLTVEEWQRIKMKYGGSLLSFISQIESDANDEVKKEKDRINKSIAEYFNNIK